MCNENKVYYKVLDKDMKSPYIRSQYELGKTYSTDKPLDFNLYHNGFHVCKNMYEMIIWTDYNSKLKDRRFFECTLGDKIIEDRYIIVSNSITLIKEIPYEEVDKNIRENLNILLNNNSTYIRTFAALQGYGLDILINDEDAMVRAAVALQDYGLDILIHDEDPRVKATVASQGYGLDILINDDNAMVRSIAKLISFP